MPAVRSRISLLLLLGLGAGGCGGGSTPAACCEPSSVRCVQGTLLVCNAQGTALAATRCPSGACQGSACLNRSCAGTIGSSRCDAGDPSRRTLITCSESGTESRTSCPEGQLCAAGACLPVPCQAGQRACGFSEVVVCTDRAGAASPWESVEDCEAKGQACVATKGGCVPRVCTPGRRRCEGGAVFVCDPRGGAETVEECGAGESCQDGACVAAACGAAPAPTQDAGASPDKGAADDEGGLPDGIVIQDIPRSQPDLPAPGKASATIGGELVVFTSSKEAEWVGLGEGGGHALSISLVRGTRKLELFLTGLSERQVGLWTEADKSAVQVEIRWSDGVVQRTRDETGCATDGWTSCADSYRVELTRFGAAGERVVGTFEATLRDGTEITAGSFDVDRKR